MSTPSLPPVDPDVRVFIDTVIIPALLARLRREQEQQPKEAA